MFFSLTLFSLFNPQLLIIQTTTPEMMNTDMETPIPTRFDILAGPTYPIDPPHVYFCGTHSGLADMNPNLHRNGTVCLSLLGTFDGPDSDQRGGAGGRPTVGRRTGRRRSW